MKREERTVVVSGASRGIGFAIVQELLKYDHIKVIAVTRNMAKLNDVVQKFPDRIDLINLDYTTMKDGQIVDSFRKFEKIDVLINNAAILKNRNFEDFSNVDVEKMFQVNVVGTMQLIRCILPKLKASPNAHVVNISSMAGITGAKKFSGLSVYSASKAAVCSITESLAEEYKETSVRFNCIAPGAVDTEMFQQAFPGVATKTPATEMARFITDFALNNYDLFNGKIIQANDTTP